MASSAASRSWTKRWQTHAACPWLGTADTVSAPKGSLRTGPGPGRCLSCLARDGRLLRQCGALSANGGWCQRGNEPVTRFQSLVQFREQRSRSSSPGAAVPEQQSRSSSPGAAVPEPIRRKTCRSINFTLFYIKSISIENWLYKPIFGQHQPTDGRFRPQDLRQRKESV